VYKQPIFRIKKADATLEELISIGGRPLGLETDYWIVLAKTDELKHFCLMRMLKSDDSYCINFEREELNVILS
jgi:hypothetical protein